MKSGLNLSNEDNLINLHLNRSLVLTGSMDSQCTQRTQAMSVDVGLIQICLLERRMLL